MDRLTERKSSCLIKVCGMEITNYSPYWNAVSHVADLEDLEEREKLLIQAYAIENGDACPHCGFHESCISETWIRPDLLGDKYYIYATKEEAEEVFEKRKLHKHIEPYNPHKEIW